MVPRPLACATTPSRTANLFALERQQKHAGDDGTATEEDRDVDRLLFFDFQRNRPELYAGGFLGVTESSLDQAQAAGGYENDSGQFGCVHGDGSLLGGWMSE
jgi:hypothetical protein